MTGTTIATGTSVTVGITTGVPLSENIGIENDTLRRTRDMDGRRTLVVHQERELKVIFKPPHPKPDTKNNNQPINNSLNLNKSVECRTTELRALSVPVNEQLAIAQRLTTALCMKTSSKIVKVGKTQL